MKKADLSGERFCRLVVVDPAPNKRGRTAWECLCDCGSRVVVNSGLLRSGRTKSCGCLSKEQSSINIKRAKAPRDPVDRFLNKVSIDSESGCHVWTGARRDYGYGLFIVRGERSRKPRESMSAHRFAWEMKNGPIPRGMCVLHKCDNPLCVNADHLFLGTRDDNNKDRAQKNRSADTHGEKHPRAKLTNKQAEDALLSKESTSSIAVRLCVSYHTIHKIRKGNNWKKLKEEIGNVPD